MALSVKSKRIFSWVFITIGLLVAIPLVVALFVNKDFSVERDIIIEKPVNEVFDYIRYLRNQDSYSVWAGLDPDMKQEYRGRDGTVGFVSAWEGNEDVGRGEQEITEIREGERIDYALRFFEPFESEADAYFITETAGENRTRVVWGFDSSMPYPMNLMLLFMDLEEAIGDDYQTGLRNLKELLEVEMDDTD
jgi:uncharacterized protein YndB with AHSA1/START domain